ncbi:MAG: nucleotidyl transferase AbiEii/AbiGii toxin family protein [Elusimicrobiota bacterium]
MHSAVQAMLAKYECKTIEDNKNALLEIIQEIALLGLFRAGFFESAAFYGGTALRIFYGLQRFSQDLDFSLLQSDANFNIGRYCAAIQTELAAYGFDVEVIKKNKITASAIESAFIKGGTQIHLLKIGAIRPPVMGVHENELLKIKLEVDINPPAGSEYEIKYLLSPIPFSVRVFTDSSLFAGKLHAILCRNWKSWRVKGRDLYDYVWYLTRKISVNAKSLEERMKQTGHLKPKDIITTEVLFTLLERKFKSIDYKQAKRDALPFIRDAAEIDQWSEEFFTSITRDRLTLETGKRGEHV